MPLEIIRPHAMTPMCHALPHVLRRWRPLQAGLMLALALSLPLAHAASTDDASPAAIPGLHDVLLDAQAWIARAPDPDIVLLDQTGIAAQNARMRALDPSVRRLDSLPDVLDATQVRADITALSRWPQDTLHGDDGQPVPLDTRTAIEANLALHVIPAHTTPAYGLVVRRAALRTFPTALRVFRRVGETDIDRFQESALFPGDQVAIVHRSTDGHWLFVHSERYSAWIAADDVATGPRATVLGYGRTGPARVITGATAFTVYTPDEPRVSHLQLDMGVRLPVLRDWPAGQPVNGQHPQAAWVIQLPVRDADGQLELVPALLPRSQDTAADYLPLTRRHLLQQAFKFLGERYGWGHDFNARDCSGFLSEVYRSFGILLPRNTGAQASSPALERETFGADAAARTRNAAASRLQPGDMVFIPGHVMLAIGQVDGQPWVIHDIAGGGWTAADGSLVHAKLNGVSVTPLAPLRLDTGTRYLDAMTTIARLPRSTTAP